LSNKMLHISPASEGTLLMIVRIFSSCTWSSMSFQCKSA
jgi:hypothetical protein